MFQYSNMKQIFKINLSLGLAYVSYELFLLAYQPLPVMINQIKNSLIIADFKSFYDYDIKC